MLYVYWLYYWCVYGEVIDWYEIIGAPNLESNQYNHQDWWHAAITSLVHILHFYSSKSFNKFFTFVIDLDCVVFFLFISQWLSTFFVFLLKIRSFFFPCFVCLLHCSFYMIKACNMMIPHFVSKARVYALFSHIYIPAPISLILLYGIVW